MTKYAQCLLTVLICTAAASSPALATGKTKEKHDSTAAPAAQAPASPSIRPVYQRDGSFYFCLADYPYQDGRKLTVALSSKNQMNIGLTIPQGHFRPGGKYDLLLSLDKADGRKNRAEALDEETLLLQMGTNPSFRKKLTAAQSLSVSANDHAMGFELPPMAPLMKGLQTCLEDKANTRDEKIAQAEKLMPELLKALLITAGFTDIRPLSTDHIPEKERPADYIWRTGNLMAGIRERLVPQDKTLSDMVGLHMQGLKKQCNGAFKAEVGKEKTVGGLHLRLAEASCTPKSEAEGKAVMVATIFYLTPKGSFTVFTHEAPSSFKDEALAARDKLAKALLDLAREEETKN
ncbi:MAG: hypothetical protein PHW63_06125 [Alphaproteobacteria bacterium]|nr:hypothetical protein [Alphaproteobacteria bacterium]